MEWILLVIVAVLFASATIFVDNYVSDYYFKGRDAAAQKFFFIFAQLIVGVVLLVIFGSDLAKLDTLSIILFLLSGMISVVSSIFYYKALEIDDSTNLGIFIQLAPILYLVLGWMFLGQTISALQLMAFVVILAAPLLIILTARKRSRKLRLRAVGFSFLYVFIAVVGNLIFVQHNSPDINFACEMGLVFVGKGLGNALIMLARPSWRKRWKYVFSRNGAKMLRPLAFSFSLGVIKEFCYRGALILAPSVAIASVASDSAQPIVVFFMGVILTLIAPKFGREKLDKKTVIVHLIATILVVAGIILIQVT